MTDTSHDHESAVPNHHAHHKGFAGIRGWLAARSMRVGRTSDAELAIELTGLAAGERLVDVGCGPGVAARLAASRGAHVVGVDPADVMLRVARGDDPNATVTWRTGTAESLPVPDDSCDVVWALSTVHHWADLDASLRQVRRVLSPGGRFLATERNVKPGATGHASHGWTPPQADAFAECCRAAGFTRVTVTTGETTRGAMLAVTASAPS